MSEDYYTLLSEQIANSQTVANSDFYVDGYHIFNKQEELILFQLMKYAKSVTVVLTHDLNSEVKCLKCQGVHSLVYKMGQKNED